MFSVVKLKGTIFMFVSVYTIMHELYLF